MTAPVLSPPTQTPADRELSADELSQLLSTGQPATASFPIGWLVLSLVPFWLIPAAHVASNPHTATGFFHYELPYYVANGRAAFDRGNGVLYPNPYDPAADSPNIYAHWLPWLFGVGVAKLNLDPGDLVLAATFFASVLLAGATFTLIQVRTKTTGEAKVGYLLAMLGGGSLVVFGALAALLQSTGLSNILLFDPGQGLWFLNWGRNALFPTEAVYHSLVAGCWFAEIKGRFRWSNAFLLLLAMTHPWSGIELLCTINLWRLIDFAVTRKKTAAMQLTLSCAAMIAFLGYYKVWLPGFPSHAQLQTVWELNWNLSWTSAGLAYAPVAIPCVLALQRAVKEDGLNRTEQFLCCALLVALGLAFHDRLIKPVQPLHFTRGYVWMPLFLLGLPVTLRWVKQLRRRGPALMWLLLLIVAADNLGFAAVHVHAQLETVDGFHLDAHERALLKQLDESTSGAVVLTESDDLNYLLPTYASVRPWLGHRFNTPEFHRRLKQKQAVFANGMVQPAAVPDDVDVLVTRRSRDNRPLSQSPVWQTTAIRNAQWVVWHRYGSAAGR